MSFIYMSKEDFDCLVERSLELAEFHGDDIRDAAKAAKSVPEGATHFAKMEWMPFFNAYTCEDIEEIKR